MFPLIDLDPTILEIIGRMLSPKDYLHFKCVKPNPYNLQEGFYLFDKYHDNFVKVIKKQAEEKYKKQVKVAKTAVNGYRPRTPATYAREVMVDTMNLLIFQGKLEEYISTHPFDEKTFRSAKCFVFNLACDMLKKSIQETNFAKNFRGIFWCDCPKKVYDVKSHIQFTNHTPCKVCITLEEKKKQAEEKMLAKITAQKKHIEDTEKNLLYLEKNILHHKEELKKLREKYQTM